MKCSKVPEDITATPFQKILSLNGLSVIESCSVNASGRKGSAFLEDHLLLFVQQGTYNIRVGKCKYVVRKNEMVLLKKAILMEYDKEGDPDNNNIFEYMMFFLKDEFLIDFMKIANIQSIQVEELVPVSVKPVNERLLGFVESIKPYFQEQEDIDAGLLKIKMLELLFDLASTDKNLLQQILQLKKQARADITVVVEDNFTNPVSLTELAYLSGRSLSTFKRDFQAIYQVSPAQWIREKRLMKAKELLGNTGLTVTDVCYSTGFENMAHFSRLYKEHFGYSPSTHRQGVVAN